MVHKTIFKYLLDWTPPHFLPSFSQLPIPTGQPYHTTESEVLPPRHVMLTASDYCYLSSSTYMSSDTRSLASVPVIDRRERVCGHCHPETTAIFLSWLPNTDEFQTHDCVRTQTRDLLVLRCSARETNLL